VDRVYKAGIPAARRSLEELRVKFAQVDSRTDWSKLRVEPLLQHARTLERLLRAKEFSGETSRLRGGVVMFHSDLVYFRDNVKALKAILESEVKSSVARSAVRRSRGKKTTDKRNRG
jgi:hypothetical protein